MKKRFKKLDAVAAALLVGTVATMTLAQVADPPQPVLRWCAGGSVTINGVTVNFAGRWCLGTEACGLDIEYNDEDGSFTATRICIPRPS